MQRSTLRGLFRIGKNVGLGTWEAISPSHIAWWNPSTIASMHYGSAMTSFAAIRIGIGLRRQTPIDVSPAVRTSRIRPSC